MNFKQFTGQSAATTGANICDAGNNPTDVVGYNSAFFIFTTTAGVGAGAVTFEQSMDGTTWLPLPASDLTSTQGNYVTSVSLAASTAYLYWANVGTAFVRLRVSTTVTGGTISASVRMCEEVFSGAGNSLTVQQNLPSQLQAAVSGPTAHSAARTANPVTVGGQVVTALDTTLVNGDVAYLMQTAAGQLVIKPFGDAANDWQAALTLTTNTATAAKAAGAASIRNYCTQVTVQNTNATATTLLILDGGTTLWQVSLPASMTLPVQFVFPTPLRGTAATAMNVNCGTTGANVLVNITGYQSF